MLQGRTTNRGMGCSTNFPAKFCPEKWQIDGSVDEQPSRMEPVSTFGRQEALRCPKPTRVGKWQWAGFPFPWWQHPKSPPPRSLHFGACSSDKLEMVLPCRNILAMEWVWIQLYVCLKLWETQWKTGILNGKSNILLPLLHIPPKDGALVSFGLWIA